MGQDISSYSFKVNKDFIPKFKDMKKHSSMILRRNMVVPKISIHDSEYLDLVTETKDFENTIPKRMKPKTTLVVKKTKSSSTFSIKESIEQVSRIN